METIKKKVTSLRLNKLSILTLWTAVVLCVVTQNHTQHCSNTFAQQQLISFIDQHFHHPGQLLTRILAGGRGEPNSVHLSLSSYLLKHRHALFSMLMNSLTLWQVLCAVTDARAPVVGYTVADEWPGLAHNPFVCHDFSSEYTKKHDTWS